MRGEDDDGGQWLGSAGAVGDFAPDGLELWIDGVGGCVAGLGAAMGEEVDWCLRDGHYVGEEFRRWSWLCVDQCF